MAYMRIESERRGYGRRAGRKAAARRARRAADRGAVAAGVVADDGDLVPFWAACVGGWDCDCAGCRAATEAHEAWWRRSADKARERAEGGGR